MNVLNKVNQDMKALARFWGGYAWEEQIHLIP